ncbi:sulfotransferase domain-containing protein [Sphingomonas canadensis]|uniref:Sulfotransferase domain-containing protein n=1 Tax=Sphingomonas canadensis TaxID=1219257 RepID=A0ABW3HAX9_9SPHN|nr:sulfotransferase domain-containing protein [Sphingomonas canadensis]MCW3838134.1 sulfotransferase domain-containing protein [Sphingomonas canadensis]
MKRRIWLASYPKSGNTWLRLLLANLRADRPADINRLPTEPALASARAPFDRVTLLASGLLTPDECDLLRPAAYRAMARIDDPEEDEGAAGIDDTIFVKTHDAWTHNAAGEAMLAGADAAAGAILIVRDPRDIVASLAHHNASPCDAAIGFMADPAARFAEPRDGQPTQLRQTLTDWSGFQASWLDQREIPVHLIRYEDLQADAGGALARALAFFGVDASAAQCARAAEFARFGRVQDQEQRLGFGEAPRPQLATRFFRRGAAGGWRDELTPTQADRVEAAHAAMMVRLGYPLTERRRECA